MNVVINWDALRVFQACEVALSDEDNNFTQEEVSDVQKLYDLTLKYHHSIKSVGLSMYEVELLEKYFII